MTTTTHGAGSISNRIQASGQNISGYVAMYICQTKITACIPVRQLLMIKSH